jgi:hypothetical protein
VDLADTIILRKEMALGTNESQEWNVFIIVRGGGEPAASGSALTIG